MHSWHTEYALVSCPGMPSGTPKTFRIRVCLQAYRIALISPSPSGAPHTSRSSVSAYAFRHTEYVLVPYQGMPSGIPQATLGKFRIRVCLQPYRKPRWESFVSGYASSHTASHAGKVSYQGMPPAIPQATLEKFRIRVCLQAYRRSDRIGKGTTSVVPKSRHHRGSAA
jgi:hypothetical protein